MQQNIQLNNNELPSIKLHCNKGGSDKIYHVKIVELDGAYVVMYANGRRGSTLKFRQKNPDPTSYSDALEIFSAIIKDKQKPSKGYTPYDTDCISLVSSNDTHTSGEIGLQHPTTIDKSCAIKLCYDDLYIAQEKSDGERRPIQIKSGKLIGFNKTEQPFTLSSNIGFDLSTDILIDCEQVGDDFFVFDILEYDRKDLRHLGFIDRYETLKSIIARHPKLTLMPIYYKSEDKTSFYESVFNDNKEGIVFRRHDSPYLPGKITKNNVFKFKFYKEASVYVVHHNSKRSVGISVCNEIGDLINVGNVTIPVDKDIPAVNSIIEVRYLYAYKNGSLFQPIYEKPRPDQSILDVDIAQLIYKPE
jgi:bifunctional non-homologous end joining protein LigD